LRKTSNENINKLGRIGVRQQFNHLITPGNSKRNRKVVVTEKKKDAFLSFTQGNLDQRSRG